eukprot:jgi/Ulvmu1/7881/UM004_0112.1
MVAKVPCGACASPIPNNLVSTQGAVAFVHNDQIVLQDLNDSSKNSSKRQMQSIITAIRGTYLGNEQVIISTAGDGLMVWDAELTRCLYEAPVTPVGPHESQVPHISQAICVCHMADAVQICIGTSTGSVHLYTVTPPSSLSQAAVLDGDGVPVLALEWLSGTAGNLCVSNSNGNVSLYTVGTESIVFHKSLSMSVPVVLLGSAQQKLFCGSAHGDISVLDKDTLTVELEIAAHSRFLSTMVLHSREPLLLTAAQDGTAAVWDLSELGTNKVKVIQSYLWNNAMIAGGVFGGKNRVYFSSYSGVHIGLFEYSQAGCT